MKKKNKIAIVVILILVLCGSFILGFYTGADVTIRAVTKIAKGFIDIDETLVREAIYQYQNNLGNCFPPK